MSIGLQDWHAIRKTRLRIGDATRSVELVLIRVESQHALRRNNTYAVTAKKCCVSEVGKTDDGNVRN